MRRRIPTCCTHLRRAKNGCCRTYLRFGSMFINWRPVRCDVSAITSQNHSYSLKCPDRKFSLSCDHIARYQILFRITVLWQYGGLRYHKSRFRTIWSRIFQFTIVICPLILLQRRRANYVEFCRIFNFSKYAYTH